MRVSTGGGWLRLEDVRAVALFEHHLSADEDHTESDCAEPDNGDLAEDGVEEVLALSILLEDELAVLLDLFDDEFALFPT